MKQLDQDSDERKNRLIMPHYPTVSFPMGVSTGEFNFCGPQGTTIAISRGASESVFLGAPPPKRHAN